ncbi:hypothetical protein J3A83DRAFT_4370058 [Scleroderma citrinum]
MPSSIAWPVRVTSELSIDEFVYHPNSRQLAAFLQGWVLMASFLCLTLSSSTKHIRRWLSSTFRARRLAASSRFSEVCTEKAAGSFSNNVRGVDWIIIFTLYMCFGFSALANFLSLLTLPTTSGSFTCALVVAWGGISGVCGRLLGLTTLYLELWRLGITKIEICMVCLATVSAIALAFADCALGAGVTKLLPQLDAYVCYKVRYFPIALTRSVVHVLLDVYALGRLVLLIAPRFLSIRHRIEALKDTRTIRIMSLLVFEVLLIVPSVRSVGVVGDSVICTVGSLLVLASFFNGPSGHSDVDDLASLPPLSVGSTTRPATSFMSVDPRIPPSIPNHPFSVGVTSSSTINIGPSTVWPYALISTDSLSRATTPSMRTTRVHVASKMRLTWAKYVLASHPGWMVERTLPMIMDGEPLDHYFTKLERLGIIGRHDESPWHTEQEKQQQECTGEKPTSPALVPPEMRNDLPDGANQHHSSHAECSTAESSVRGTALSQHSWFSLLKPVPSSRPPLYVDNEERWLTFGECSSSPTRRQRFSDQLHRFSEGVVPPVHTLEAYFRNSRAAYRPTPSSSSEPEKMKGSIYVGSNVDGRRHHVIPRKVNRVRLRGPRPLQPRDCL